MISERHQNTQYVDDPCITERNSLFVEEKTPYCFQFSLTLCGSRHINKFEVTGVRNYLAGYQILLDRI